MTKEDVQKCAFQMIAYAGEAISLYLEAIKSNMNGNIDESWNKYSEGNKQLNDCHQIQTKLIFAESKGEDIPYCLVMTHAQDHFTTAINWQNVCNVFMKKN